MSSCEELLQKDGLVSVQHRNNHSLAIEMLHVKHRQSCEVVSDIFTQTTESSIFDKIEILEYSLLTHCFMVLKALPI